MGITGTLLILAAGTALLAGPTHAMGQRLDPSSGDTLMLTLQGARDLALAQSPNLMADRLAIAIALGDVRQARVDGLNPTLEVERYESGNSRRTAEFSVALITDLPWSGQRGLRIDAAQAGLDRRVAEVDDAERRAVAIASLTFIRALATRQRLGVADTMVMATQRLYAVTRIQLREGEISSLEANLAEIEFGRAQARLHSARRDAVSALRELHLAIGVGPELPIRLVGMQSAMPDPGSLSEAQLIASALNRRPDLVALQRTIDQARLERRLAARQAIPVPQVSGLLSRDAGDTEARLGVGLRLALPFIDRNQGRVDRETARLDQAQFRFDALALAARLQASEAYKVYVTASEESAALERLVLGPARRSLELLEIAYQAGKVGLPTLLLLRNQLLDAELEYWNAWQARHDALLRLELAIGVPIGEVQSTPLAPKENNR
ncbi:MAG: TolC family protein [Gemmatimonadales bacterium]